jgi:ribosomal protein S12 methylthiotransferase accessory factor
MLVKPVGRSIWVGPVFRPGLIGCWQCVAQRLSDNRRVEQFVRERIGATNQLAVPTAALPSTKRLALQLAATEIAVTVVQDAQSLEWRHSHI